METFNAAVTAAGLTTVAMMAEALGKSPAIRSRLVALGLKPTKRVYPAGAGAATHAYPDTVLAQVEAYRPNLEIVIRDF